MQKTEPLTTESLAVPGIEVVGVPKGKAFAGPFYPDKVEQLRNMCRGMRPREKFVVTETATGAFWIYRKS